MDIFEQTTIILMEKNKLTNVLEKELGVYTVESCNNIISNIYAVNEEGNYKIYLFLTTFEDVKDWEFEAIFDYYDVEVFNKITQFISIEEEENRLNPTWKFVLEFSENDQAMEECLNDIVSTHIQELKSVLTEIADKENEYL